MAEWCEEAIVALSAVAHGASVVALEDGRRENNG